MSLGGYGPVQYWALADDALTLSPKIVVVGLYFGNDLYDAYAMVYCFNRNYASLRRPDAPADFANDTVGARANAYWDQEKSFQQTYLRPGLSGFGDWLRGHTAVGRLVSRARLWPGASDVEFETAKAWAQAFPDRAAVYEEGGVRTVFTTAYRQVALDQSEPRVAEGMRITKELLPQIKQKADASGAHLLILLIPTKESAHAEALRARGRRLDPTLESLAGWESRARSEIVSTCEEEGIQYADALPALSAAIARGEQLYPTGTESHPNARGYYVLASTVGDALAKRGW